MAEGTRIKAFPDDPIASLIPPFPGHERQDGHREGLQGERSRPGRPESPAGPAPWSPSLCAHFLVPWKTELLLCPAQTCTRLHVAAPADCNPSLPPANKSFLSKEGQADWFLVNVGYLPAISTKRAQN